MKKIIKLLLVLTMFFSMSVTCFAAPSIDATGNVVDDALPTGFTSGYTYGDFSTYNSPAEQNGLGDTFIWIEGTFSSVQTISSAGLSTAYTTATDIYGNNWVLLLDAEQYTPLSAYESIYNKPLGIAGQYTGFSNVMQMPAITVVKIADISLGTVWYSTLASLCVENIPGETATVTEQDAYNTMAALATSLSGRYYFTDNFYAYRPHVYVDIVGNADGSITYTTYLAGIQNSSKIATFYQTDGNAFYYSDGSNVLGFYDNDLLNPILMLAYPTGAIHNYIKL